MARFEGKQPNTGAIIIGAIIFALVAAGLFFAFRPVPEPTSGPTSNSTGENVSSPTDANSADTGATGANATDANATGDGANANGLSTILTPLPTATPQPIETAQPMAPVNSANAAPVGNSVAPTAPATAPLIPQAGT